MNPPKVDDLDYIQFLIAAQKAYTCTEASRSHPEEGNPPAHDAYGRMLQRQPPETEALWHEAKPLIDRSRGLLQLDDTTLDKPYARHIEPVSRHWSGKHHRVVQGINLITLLWSDGLESQKLIPCDFRLYDKPTDGQSKNDHFCQMLRTARMRGFHPASVLFDGWYSSLKNLKLIDSFHWKFFTRLKDNRLVNPDGQGNVPISEVLIPPNGRRVHLRGLGFIKVFRTVRGDGEVQYWATNELEMNPKTRRHLAKKSWGIESYHRGLKQCCGVERAQVRNSRAVLTLDATPRK
jgi:hypothetical protein